MFCFLFSVRVLLLLKRSEKIQKQNQPGNQPAYHQPFASIRHRVAIQPPHQPLTPICCTDPLLPAALAELISHLILFAATQYSGATAAARRAMRCPHGDRAETMGTSGYSWCFPMRVLQQLDLP